MMYVRVAPSTGAVCPAAEPQAISSVSADWSKENRLQSIVLCFVGVLGSSGFTVYASNEIAMFKSTGAWMFHVSIWPDGSHPAVCPSSSSWSVTIVCLLSPVGPWGPGGPCSPGGPWEPGGPGIGESHLIQMSMSIPTMLVISPWRTAPAGVDNSKNKVTTTTKTPKVTRANFMIRNWQIRFCRLC